MLRPIVIYEDNHLLVVNKPAGMPTAGVTDRASLYQWCGDYLKHKYQKPGNVFVGIVSRLDTLTSGLIVVARTSKGAARLSEQIRLGKMSKTYWALVEGRVEPPQGTWRQYLRKDDAAHRMRVCRQQGHPASQLAELSYQVTGRDRCQGREVSLATVQLVTGRKHQIRVQFAHHGFPVVGDHKYGSSMHLLGEGIGLHSYGLQFDHPTRDERLQFEQPPPGIWPNISPMR